MEKRCANVLLVDDQTLYREGLRELFKYWDEFNVVGEAENGLAAIDFCQKNTPDLILMDIRMPILDGVQASRRILANFPEIAIVVLTMSIDDESLFEAISLGARGYILKDIPARQLCNHLRSVLQGEAALSNAVTSRVFKQLNRHQVSYNPDKEPVQEITTLTETEIDIIKLVALGMSNEEIASHLYLSEGTVKKKVASLLQKLSLDNRIQAAAYAVRVGLAE